VSRIAEITAPFIPAGKTLADLAAIVRRQPEQGRDLARTLASAALAEPMLDREICDILYPGLIEPLCDDFSLPSARAADLVLAGIIEALAGEGTSPGDLFRRREESRRSSLDGLTPGTALFISRVTAGADVMITSVLMARIHAAFPGCEIHLAVTRAIAPIFAAPLIHIHPVEVNRHGGLMERFSFRPQLSELAAELIGPGDLIVDPESRLSQLGLLPLTERTKTLLFPSRTYQSDDEEKNLAELANLWLDDLGCPAPHRSPEVHLPDETRKRAAMLKGKLVPEGNKAILINLGVGGNERKRLDFADECAIMRAIMRQDGVTILLDSGRGMEEKSRVAAIIEACGGVCEKIHPLDLDLAEVAALIAESDAFLGYDSSCQHLAVAVTTPGLTIFKGFPCQRFKNRWKPASDGSRIIPVTGMMEREQFETIISAILEPLI